MVGGRRRRFAEACQRQAAVIPIPNETDVGVKSAYATGTDFNMIAKSIILSFAMATELSFPLSRNDPSEFPSQELLVA